MDVLNIYSDHITRNNESHHSKTTTTPYNPTQYITGTQIYSTAGDTTSIPAVLYATVCVKHRPTVLNNRLQSHEFEASSDNMSQCQQGALFVVPHNRNSSRHSQPRHSQPLTNHTLVVDSSVSTRIHDISTSILAQMKNPEISYQIYTQHVTQQPHVSTPIVKITYNLQPQRLPNTIQLQWRPYITDHDENGASQYDLLLCTLRYSLKTNVDTVQFYVCVAKSAPKTAFQYLYESYFDYMGHYTEYMSLETFESELKHREIASQNKQNGEQITLKFKALNKTLDKKQTQRQHHCFESITWENIAHEQQMKLHESNHEYKGVKENETHKLNLIEWKPHQTTRKLKLFELKMQIKTSSVSQRNHRTIAYKTTPHQQAIDTQDKEQIIRKLNDIMPIKLTTLISCTQNTPPQIYRQRKSSDYKSYGLLNFFNHFCHLALQSNNKHSRNKPQMLQQLNNDYLQLEHFTKRRKNKLRKKQKVNNTRGQNNHNPPTTPSRINNNPATKPIKPKKHLPHAGGKKKKKKKHKKRHKKLNKEPEQDPHFSPSRSKQLETKAKRKYKRKTHFEVDDVAPTIQISRNYDRNKNRSSVPGGFKRGRRPKGTRTVVRSGGNTNIDIQTLQNLEARRKRPTRVWEDKSGDEEQNDDNLMDIDVDKDNDPWKGEQYAPVSLDTDPSYGKSGKIKQNVMFDVFEEKEQFGNDFVFIQMPPMLPLVSHLTQDEKRDLANFKKVEQSLLRQMGEGEIGKIRIRKSGKTELVIGDYVMNVNFASPTDCYQQVMHIHCENTPDGQIKGKSQFLGNVPPQNNLVCSYKAEDLLL
eukprot:955194_1